MRLLLRRYSMPFCPPQPGASPGTDLLIAARILQSISRPQSMHHPDEVQWQLLGPIPRSLSRPRMIRSHLQRRTSSMVSYGRDRNFSFLCGSFLIEARLMHTGCINGGVGGREVGTIILRSEVKGEEAVRGCAVGDDCTSIA